MSNNKISIIIPVYNLENYIKRTFDCVFSQTYKNIEVIAVDDGSSDKSWDIMVEYAKSENRLICIHQENGGVTSARINGVKNATGDWIGFVDGDDLIDDDMYEFLLSNALKYNVDISHCGYKMVLGNKRTDYYYGTGRIIEQDNLSGIKDLIKGSFVEPGLCNKLFKRELFNSILHKNIMDFKLKNLEDLLMNYYLFKDSRKSIFVDECKYHYIVRNNSAATSSFKPNKFNDPICVFKTIIQQSENQEIKNIAFSRYIGVLLGLCVANIPKSYKKLASKMIKQDLKQVLSSTFINKKQKLMAILASYFHPFYSLIRKVYVKVTKVDQKYSIE